MSKKKKNKLSGKELVKAIKDYVYWSSYYSYPFGILQNNLKEMLPEYKRLIAELNAEGRNMYAARPTFGDPRAKGPGGWIYCTEKKPENKIEVALGKVRLIQAAKKLQIEIYFVDFTEWKEKVRGVK